MRQAGLVGACVDSTTLALPGQLQNFSYVPLGWASRSWGVSMEYRFTKLAQYLRGRMGYFGISDYYHPIPELDGWLR